MKSLPQQLTADQLSVRIEPIPALLASQAAQMVGTYLQSCLRQQEFATVVLATGNSQLQFLDELMRLEALDWSRLICFHLDEYLGIAPEHPASFRRYLHERVECRARPGQFHYLQGDALEPLAECDRYAQLLRSRPIDLCCLGIGDNGHLAFNEPNVANFQDPYAVKLVKLAATTRQQQVNSGLFPAIAAVPTYAFTLSIPSICAAKQIVCLAPGRHKAEIVRQMLRGPIHPGCPASVLRTQAQATLFLDAEAAELFLHSAI